MSRQPVAEGIKYFHQISLAEYEDLLTCGITYEELASQHPQPEWCNYHEPLLDMLGCWSLVSFVDGKSMVTGEAHCKRCGLYNPSPPDDTI